VESTCFASAFVPSKKSILCFPFSIFSTIYMGSCTVLVQLGSRTVGFATSIFFLKCSEVVPNSSYEQQADGRLLPLTGKHLELLGCRCLLVLLQSVLDCGQRLLKRRDRAAHRGLSNDRSLDASQARLLGAHGHDQIKTGLLRVITPANAEREVQRGPEVVARIELFLSDGICNLIRRVPTHGHHLHDTQRWLQPEFYSRPVERVFDVRRFRVRVGEKVMEEIRQVFRQGLVITEHVSELLGHLRRVTLVVITPKARLPSRW
jgi:hypothetical protein